MASTETSPFIFDGPVPPSDLVGRSGELALLADRAAHGRHVLLYAPRRFGKTSLLRSLADDVAGGQDLAVIIADLMGVLTLDDVARRLVSSYRQLPARSSLAKALLRAAAGLTQLGIIVAGTGLSVTHQRGAPAPELLEHILELPAEAARRSGRRVLVVLDEFQAIDDIKSADAVLRSKIQHQRDHVSYIFSGSEQGILQAVFSDAARPLYGQAEQVRLGPLPDHELAEFVASRFEETGRAVGEALTALVAVARGHPQRSMLAAHHLWEATPAGAAADAGTWQDAEAAVLDALGPELTELHAALSPAQRKVLRLLAHRAPIYGAAAKRLGLLGEAATKAVAVLARRSVAVRRAEGERWELVDPFLARWVQVTQPAP